MGQQAYMNLPNSRYFSFSFRVLFTIWSSLLFSSLDLTMSLDLIFLLTLKDLTSQLTGRIGEGESKSVRNRIHTVF